MNIIDNDLLSVQQARILAENAFEAKTKIAEFSQQRLDTIVEAIAAEMLKHAETLARMSFEETEYGCTSHKIYKNRFVCEYVAKQLKDMRCVGVIKEDFDKQIMEVGVPLGVVVALVPATNPVSTTIFNTLIAIKAGNSIVFAPHQRAKKTITKTLDLIIEIADKCGLPQGAISYLSAISNEGIEELAKHKCTAIVLNTGVCEMFEVTKNCGKPYIYGGFGNGPAFIERTADCEQAVKDIITSKTFDNGIVPAAEQSIIVDVCVEACVRAELIKNGAYFMNEEQSEKLGYILYDTNGVLAPEAIGKTAEFLAKKAGFDVPKNTVLLVSEQKYVFKENPFSREKLCPVISYYIEKDWRHACEKCIELILGEKLGHTLTIHSRDEDVIRQFAIKKPVGRMLVNTPAVFGSMGATTNLFPSMTLGSGSVGAGITSDNVSPLNLIYVRRVGYGLKKIDVNLI